jgi:aspartate kinase
MASKLDEVSYDEMLELAHAGANVLHPRSVETAKQFSVPMRVRSSFNLDNLGTLITGVENMEIYKPVTGVAADLSQARIVVCDVPDKPGVAAQIFSHLADKKISVDMIIQSYARKVSNTNDIAFTIDSADLDKTLETLDELKSILNSGKVEVDSDTAKVSIVGAGMIDRPGIASSMFKTLADQGINIKMISTSEIKISCLVDKSNAQKAVKALHDIFELGSDVVADVKGTLPDC